MPVAVPIHVQADDLDAELQMVEVTNDRLIVRLRDRRFARLGATRVQVPSLLGSGAELISADGRRVNLEQAAGGGGPFDGIVDLAFLLDRDFDLKSPLQLVFDQGRFSFSLSFQS